MEAQDQQQHQHFTVHHSTNGERETQEDRAEDRNGETKS